MIIYVLNPFPNKPWFLRVCSTGLSKTLWEKEKMLVTSIFSFSHSVFYSIKEINHHFSNIQFVVCKCFHFGHIQNSVLWERVNTFQNTCNPLFLCVCYTSLLEINTVEKGEIARYKQFLLFPCVFYTFVELCVIFHQI